MPERNAAPPALGRRREARQQRSVETQARLLEAAIACLVDHGYAGLKTAEIAQRAGLSEGALFRHYPTKADLVVAAVERVFADLERRHARLLAQAGAGADVIAAAVRALWRVMTLPAYLATNEVYLAARTDPALRQAIQPMARRHQDNLLQRARALVGNPDPSEFDDGFDALVLAMQAAAIDAVALQDRGLERRRLAYFEAFARRIPPGPPFSKGGAFSGPTDSTSPPRRRGAKRRGA